jgi:hypothetical protein
MAMSCEPVTVAPRHCGAGWNDAGHVDVVAKLQISQGNR